MLSGARLVQDGGRFAYVGAVSAAAARCGATVASGFLVRRTFAFSAVPRAGFSTRRSALALAFALAAPAEARSASVSSRLVTAAAAPCGPVAAAEPASGSD